MASYGSKLTFEKTDLDHFPARVFLDFPRKIGFRVSGTKKNSRMSNNEYRMSNNEYRDSSMNIGCPTMNIGMSNNEYRDPSMNSLMDFQFFEIQFFEIQFFGLLDPGPPILGVRI